MAITGANSEKVFKGEVNISNVQQIPIYLLLKLFQTKVNYMKNILIITLKQLKNKVLEFLSYQMFQNSEIGILLNKNPI